MSDAEDLGRFIVYTYTMCGCMFCSLQSFLHGNLLLQPLEHSRTGDHPEEHLIFGIDNIPEAGDVAPMTAEHIAGDLMASLNLTADLHCIQFSNSWLFYGDGYARSS